MRMVVGVESRVREAPVAPQPTRPARTGPRGRGRSPPSSGRGPSALGRVREVEPHPDAVSAERVEVEPLEAGKLPLVDRLHLRVGEHVPVEFLKLRGGEGLEVGGDLALGLFLPGLGLFPPPAALGLPAVPLAPGLLPLRPLSPGHETLGRRVVLPDGSDEISARVLLDLLRLLLLDPI